MEWNERDLIPRPITIAMVLAASPIHPRAFIDNNEQQRDEMEIYQLVCEFNNSQRELRLPKQLVPASAQTLLLPTKPESEKMLLEKKI